MSSQGIQNTSLNTKSAQLSKFVRIRRDKQNDENKKNILILDFVKFFILIRIIYIDIMKKCITQIIIQ